MKLSCHIPIVVLLLCLSSIAWSQTEFAPFVETFDGPIDDDDPVTPPPAPTVTGTIGPAGGALEMPGRMILVIPAGALAGDVEFTAGPAGGPPALPPTADSPANG